MKKLLTILAVLMLAMFLLAPAAYAQTEDGTCSDGLDNDSDGLIDQADASCTDLSEAPDPTPTAAPTPEPTAEVTAAPTAEPTVTPTDLPDTGGDPGDGDTTGETPQDLQFTEWLAQTGAIGIVTSFILMIVTMTGLAVTSMMKRIGAITLSIGLTVLYIAMKDNIALNSLEDVFATALGAMVTSQVAYMLVSQSIGNRFGAERTT